MSDDAPKMKAMFGGDPDGGFLGLPRERIFVTPLGGQDVNAVVQGLERAKGYLRGQIDSELLGNRFATGFQQAQRAWLRGEFDLEGMRRDALISCFIVLAADAKPKFHKRLIEAIRRLQE